MIREHDPDALLDSDGEREVIECHAEPVTAADLCSDVVVAAAEVLHEGRPGSQKQLSTGSGEAMTDPDVISAGPCLTSSLTRRRFMGVRQATGR